MLLVLGRQCTRVQTLIRCLAAPALACRTVGGGLRATPGEQHSFSGCQCPERAAFDETAKVRELLRVGSGRWQYWAQREEFQRGAADGQRGDGAGPTQSLHERASDSCEAPLGGLHRQCARGDAFQRAAPARVEDGEKAYAAPNEHQPGGRGGESDEGGGGCSGGGVEVQTDVDALELGSRSHAQWLAGMRAVSCCLELYF